MEKNNPDEEDLMQKVMLLENVAKKKMTKEAISRYGNLKMAHPEIAIRAIALIAQASQTGQISGSIDDVEFKNLLREIQQGKKQFNFKR